MEVSASPVQQRRGKRRSWLLAILPALGLLAAAWALAEWPPIRRATTPAEIEAVSLGFNLLVAGALPWLLQWAGLAFLLAAVARGWLRATWPAVLLGMGVPLVVGLVWWIGLASTFWNRDPIEALNDVLFLSTRLQFATQSLGELALHDVFGPLAFPLKLHGLASLEAADFLWAACSTALVMSLLTWTAHRAGAGRSAPARPSRKPLVLMAFCVLLYVSPSLLVTLNRLLGFW